jgi:hypothetical protein
LFRDLEPEAQALLLIAVVSPQERVPSILAEAQKPLLSIQIIARMEKRHPKDRVREVVGRQLERVIEFADS